MDEESEGQGEELVVGRSEKKKWEKKPFGSAVYTKARLLRDVRGLLYNFSYVGSGHIAVYRYLD